MGRGQSLKTIQKKAQAERLGVLLAEQKAAKSKPLQLSLREHIGKFIDRLTLDDAFSIGSVLVLTVFIKPIIETVDSIAKIAMSGEIAARFTLYGWGAPGFLSQIGIQKPQIESGKAMTDFNLYCMSFGIAVLIVKFGPSILETAGGITKLGTLLFSAG